MTQNSTTASISEQFKLAFARNPFKPAVKSGNRMFTFQELDRLSARIGRYLFEQLGDATAPVAFFFQDPIDIVAAIIGAIRSGYSYSVLSDKNPPAQLSVILADLTPGILLTDSTLLSRVQLVVPADCTIVNLSDVPEYIGEDFYRDDPAHDPVGIYYTSGSTGEPKGVMRLHSVIISRGLADADLYQLGSDDSFCLTNAFSASASLNFFSAFISNATFVVYEIDKQGFVELKRILQDEKIKVFRGSAEPLRRFFASLSETDFFPNMRLLFPYGDVIYRRDIEAWRRHIPQSAAIIVTFSASEIGVMARNVVYHDMQLGTDKLLAGYPAQNKQILLLDEQGSDVPAGEIGEIVVRSNQPFYGYWRRPDLTDKRLMPDPADPERKLYRSGDLGRFHPDGQLEHMGRKDFRVKIRGFNVDLSAIENALMSHANVQRAVVVAVEDSAGQKRLAAYVLPIKDAQVTVKELLDSVATNLPTYMIPALITIVQDLPMGVTGKVDRKALPAPLWDEITASTPFLPPSDAIEMKLAGVWKKILRTQRIGVNDNFFELGGDSLMAMQLLLEIERTFSKRMPFAIISKASTIKEQAEILRDGNFAEHSSILIPVQTNGNKKPIYCIGGKGGLPIRFNNFVKHMSKDQPVYFFRSRGFEPGEFAERTIATIAADYVRELKDVQPSGPYYFLGESSGGVVAYEMAQQLRAQGEITAFLGMLDTYIPNRMRTDRTTLSHWLTLTRKHLQTLTRGGWAGWQMYIKYYLELWKFKVYQFQVWGNERKNRLRFGDMPDVFNRVDDANVAALRIYDPKPYPGPIVLFRALRQAQFDGQKIDNGWGDVGVENLIIHEVDCYHGNILFEPFVRQIAEQTQKYLSDESL